MSTTYEELRKCIRNMGDVGFNLALTVLVQNGSEKLSQMDTDDICDGLDTNLLSEDYRKNIAELVKKLADTDTGTLVSVIQKELAPVVTSGIR